MRPNLIYQARTAPGRSKIPTAGLDPGSYLCQWQINLKTTSIPTGTLLALQEIPTLGFIPKGRWDIQPSFPLAVANEIVLVSLPFDAEFWFESDGYGVAMLSFYRYEPVTSAIIRPLPVAANSPLTVIDLAPVANAIQAAGANANSNAIAIQNQLGQLVAAGQQATDANFVEVNALPWQGDSLGGKFLAFDRSRRTVTFTVPSIDAVSGLKNVHAVYIAAGGENRPQADDYGWTVYPGSSIDIDGANAIQQLCCWQDIGTSPTLCNLVTTGI